MDRSRDGDEESPAHQPRPLTRRHLLGLAGAAANIALAGCNDGQATPTTTRTTHTTSTTTSTTEDTTTTKEEGHFAGQPDMQTPWFDDVSRDAPHPEYPRPQLVRDAWQSLNGEWDLELVDDFAEPPEPPGDRDMPETILVPFPIESQLSGIRDHAFRLWYRTTFTVPDDWTGRVILHFERVDWEAIVFVNGDELTTHRGGYDHFAVDVTDHLTGGEERLAVRVYDPSDFGTQAHGKQEVTVDEDIFYTPATGIWDSVWLEPVPETHIDTIDLTPDLDDETLHLTVHTGNGDDATVEATAIDAGSEVTTATGPADEELAIAVPDPHRWSPDDPHLYDLRIRLRDSSGTVDEVESYFGMRSVGTKLIDGVLRPTLNGEFVFRQGIYDQGYWPDGIYTPPTDEARTFNLQTVKDLGFNTLRKHLKIEPRRWFYWTDRLGLLVWQDIPQQPLGQPYENATPQPREQFEAELTHIIEQNDNHPSLTTWIPANEGWGFGKNNPERIRKTAAIVEDLDGDERLVNAMSGINTCQCDPENGDVIDLHNYGEVTPVPEPTANRISAVGESSAGWVPIPNHKWRAASGGTPDSLVSNLLRRAENNERLMREQGFSAAINLQVTDTEHGFQGVLTYDRKVLKPERSNYDDAVGQIRAANRALIDGSRTGSST